MASLSYALQLRGYAGDIATYTHASQDGSLAAALTAEFSTDELVAEFGLVPTGIDVIVRVDSMTLPADAWLDSTDRPAEARQWVPGTTDPEELAAWCDGWTYTGTQHGHTSPPWADHTCLNLATAPGIGKDHADPGDWIVRSREGAYLVLTPDQFAARFRAVRPVG